MGNWLIVSPGEPRYEVRIADVGEDHAQVALTDLLAHGQLPNDLVLKKADKDFRPLSRLKGLFGG